MFSTIYIGKTCYRIACCRIINKLISYFRMAVTLWMPLVVMGMFSLTMKISLVHAYSRNTVLWFEVGPIIRNCRDIQLQGNSTSGIHTIFPYDCCPDRPVQVQSPTKNHVQCQHKELLYTSYLSRFIFHNMTSYDHNTSVTIQPVHD